MLTRLPRRSRRGFARRHSTQVDLHPEKLQLAELHNDGAGSNGRMYATTVVHSKVLDMDITVHLPVQRRGIYPLQRMTSAGRAKKMAQCRALVDEMNGSFEAAAAGRTSQRMRTGARRLHFRVELAPCQQARTQSLAEGAPLTTPLTRLHRRRRRHLLRRRRGPR